jgi:hypothetical protein
LRIDDCGFKETGKMINSAIRNRQSAIVSLSAFGLIQTGVWRLETEDWRPEGRKLGDYLRVISSSLKTPDSSLSSMTP